VQIREPRQCEQQIAQPIEIGEGAFGRRRAWRRRLSRRPAFPESFRQSRRAAPWILNAAVVAAIKHDLAKNFASRPI
jgi:hypothetical protein